MYVGPAVGLIEGEGVGGDVGLIEGASVGVIVGLIVGEEVGTTVGLIEGASVGPAVGLIEGESVGPAVGLIDGESVGEIVGLIVGEEDILQMYPANPTNVSEASHKPSCHGILEFVYLEFGPINTEQSSSCVPWPLFGSVVSQFV